MTAPRQLLTQAVEYPGVGCPIVFLGVEAGRGGAVTSGATAAGVEHTIDAIATRLSGPSATARERAVHLLATLVRAVVIAHAAGGEALGKEVLATCRKRSGI